ncbi:NAD-dependent epimerase/dehydratase family protein [Flavivirga rizhaonensis]|uniref:NAD-dependent epimerase/dehydratase family protein n=1 Tax=Flavivirga rizhaonensis TaxID=2559571 RepID=A0A4S1E170_9FLAO|nr:NAD-dependent epimerase/dehydratase family protein [Flavivirga rizhaonensis]TGV04411.1 NAD-dependent epimerase/dehydratase family protein [Flavivirga rizhaonensis]
MKILIIGSKGFIGSHAVKYFSRSHKVWECDVVADYVNENYFIVDATNADYSDIFQQQQFDVCINCSGASSVPNSLVKPQRDFILNTFNVHKQLDAIRRYNADCKYINLSSAAVYGNPEQLPINENQTTNPISPYGVHKKMAEDVCKLFYKQYKIKCCSLRVFSAYGEGLKKQLFWDLYQKGKENPNVVLYGTGNESRDFIHVSDIINAIECVIGKGAFKSDIINIANGNEVKIKDVVQLFFEIFNETNITYAFGGEERQGDPINWCAETSLLKKLNYTQKVNLKEGLEYYIKWLKEENA